jgi:hypothetical protein
VVVNVSTSASFFFVAFAVVSVGFISAVAATDCACLLPVFKREREDVEHLNDDERIDRDATWRKEDIFYPRVRTLPKRTRRLVRGKSISFYQKLSKMCERFIRRQKHNVA